MSACDHPTHAHKGWYSRGYLPHWDEPTATQMVTLRLHDSMPAERRRDWEAILRLRDVTQRQSRLQAYLDAGYGSCWLREPRIAAVMADHDDSEEIRCPSSPLWRRRG